MRKITTFILTALLLSNVIYSQTVSTYTDGTPDDAMAIDSNGNLYASNFTGDTVFKYDMDGNGTSFITGLNTPNGLAFDSNDNLFICDFSGQSIYKYDSNGILLETIPGIVNPSGMIKSFNSDAMIFTNYTTNSIHKLAIDGVITLISNDPQLNGPVGLAYDENGVLYAGNYNDRKIYKILNDGTAIYIAQLPTDGGALPNLGFITYAQGRIWGTTMGSDKIFSVNPNEIDDYSLFAGGIQGSDDGDISVATFTTPNGIIFNEAEDTMYITDFGTKDIRKITGVVLGLNEQELIENNVFVFPNPVSDILTIQFKDNRLENFQIRVFNTNGSLVHNVKEFITKNKLTVSLSTINWEKGVYFIEISSEKTSVIKKIIK